MDSSTDRVAALEERCQKLEKSNLQQFQKEVLQELYKIK